MRGMRKISAAFVMAAMLATALGTVTLEAAKPAPQPGPDSAICEYLKAVMDYDNVSPTIYAWAAGLYKKLGCGK